MKKTWICLGVFVIISILLLPALISPKAKLLVGFHNDVIAELLPPAMSSSDDKLWKFVARFAKDAKMMAPLFGNADGVTTRYNAGYFFHKNLIVLADNGREGSCYTVGKRYLCNGILTMPVRESIPPVSNLLAVRRMIYIKVGKGL